MGNDKNRNEPVVVVAVAGVVQIGMADDTLPHK